MSTPTTPPPIERRSPVLVILGIAAVYLLGIGGIIAGVLIAGGDGSSSGSGEGGGTTTVELSLTEFAITGNLTAPAGRVDVGRVHIMRVRHVVQVYRPSVRAVDRHELLELVLRLVEIEQPGVFLSSSHRVVEYPVEYPLL